MTKISYVAGLGRNIPQNEMVDRGRIVPAPNYIPFLNMTQGQMELAIIENHARALSAWSQDPNMKKAADMISNALGKGVHVNGLGNYTGVLSDAEMWAARVINAVMYKSKPAVKGSTLLVGTGVGKLINNQAAWFRANREFVTRKKSLLLAAGYTDFVNKALSPAGYDRKDYAFKVFEDSRIGKIDREQMKVLYDGLIAKYTSLQEVEAIYNTYLPDSSHHMTYFGLSEKLNMPDRVFTKRTLHASAVEALGQLAEVPQSTAELWIGSSINVKNLAGGAGNLNAVQTGLSLAGDRYDDYLKQQAAAVNVLPVPVVLAIISLLTAAVAAAQKMYLESQKTKQLALSNAKGFGTTPFSASQSDWTGGTPTPGGGGSGSLSSNLPLILGGAAALYYFSQD
jgi:hypothetical protein